MIKFIKLIFILVCLSGITSCKPDDLRAMASNSITVTYNGKTCLPLESFIPQGGQVNVKLENLSDVDFSWFFIIFPLKGAFDPLNLDNIYFSAAVPANSIQETIFKAPMMPARYDTLCMPSNDPTQIILKYVLVVEPYPTTTQ
jgi:hypothetical protein